jgi:alpha-L-arabinofuranosidase
MIKHILRIGFFFLAVICFLHSNALSQTGNYLVVDVSQAKCKISKEIYGQFAEHLGNCIYGGIFVGEKSTIPNIHGIRKDVLEALQEIHVPVLRWPGGCFADTYHWKDGVGPAKDRPSMINIHWGGVTEDNSFGTHEFLDFCELLNTQPYVSGNVGSGTVQELSQWVEYITSDAVSPMTKWRRENGRENPWKLTYLGVGNEPWGCGGQMTPDYYSNLFRQYSNYCRDYGKNRLVRVAAGPSGDDYTNSEIIIKNLAPFMQAFSVHYYTVWPDWGHKGSATDFDESSWFPILKNALKMDEIVTRQSALLDKYNPSKSIGLFVDEWGTWYEVEPGTNPGFLYQQNSLRDAIVAASTLNIFNNHCERVKMANIAQTVNVLQAMVLTKGDQIVKTPTYYVFKMYAIHQDATMVPVSVESLRSSTSEGDLQLINASASIDKNGQLNLTACNLDAKKEQNLTIELKGGNYSKVSADIITGNKINSFNDFGKSEEVKITSFPGVKMKNSSIELTLPAHSVVLIKLNK